MHTEAQAKTLICCGPPQTVNGKEPLLHCLGSACMAWRFHDLSQETYRPVELWSKSRNIRVNAAFGDDAEWRPVGAKPGDEPDDPVGYCALAERE